MEPRIVCAANKFENGPLLIGARHFDQHMHVQMSYMGVKGSDPHIQGFIDQYGRFYNREEAWVIAEKNGQIIRDVSAAGMLFSENLY
jgi:hypothetical protein